MRMFLHLPVVFSVVFITLAMNSCVTNKKTTYLQEYDVDQYSVFTEDKYYEIQPSDNLYIRVVTADPSWSAMFNSLPVSTPTMSLSEPSLDLISYTVGQDGIVHIPYLEPIHVAGKTLEEVRKILLIELADYVTDPAITVKLVNNYVSILGEVVQPGRYPIYKEQLNIFQALAMAGDLRDYSDRYEIQIIREEPDSIIVKKFDLTDKEIIHSEFYIVMPNDVIYARPMKGKFFQMNAFPYALIITTISTTILLLSYINNTN